MIPGGPKWGPRGFFHISRPCRHFGRHGFELWVFFFFFVFWFLGLLAWARLGPSLGSAWTQLGPGFGPADWPAFMHAGLGLAPPDKLSDPKYIVKNQLDPSPIHATHLCMQGSNTSQWPLLTSYIYIYIYILQLTYTNKNLLYTAGASRMVCKSAYLGPCSYIGPKRPIKNKKLFRVYGKVLYTEHRLSAHSYLYMLSCITHTTHIRVTDIHAWIKHQLLCPFPIKHVPEMR